MGVNEIDSESKKSIETLEMSKSKGKKKNKKKEDNKERKLRPRMSNIRYSVQIERELGESSEGRQLLIKNDSKSLKRRWAALGLFCALNSTQCCVWNTWGPIGKSVIQAFPNWNKNSLALISNWGCITYLTCCLPCCWLLNETDLSTPLKIAAVLSTVATSLRCISTRTSIFTTTAHMAAIINGLSGVIIGPATALVSAVWFPTGERTTATGISSASSQIGMALSYILGPALVGLSKNNNSPLSSRSSIPSLRTVQITGPSLNFTDDNNNSSRLSGISVYQINLQDQIMSLMRIEFVIQCMVLIGILACFPKQSQISNTNIQVSTLGLSESLIKITRNKNMWFLCLSAALTQGMTSPWLAMITMAFGTITQEESDKLAFWTVVLSSILCLVTSRIMDIVQGHLKTAISILLIISSMMFLWIILLDCKVLVFHKHKLYAAVILGIATNWSTSALYLELASEISFPISEAIVGGYMIFLSNIVGMIFYLSYCIPGMGGRWSTCLVFANISISAIFIICVKEEYNRTKRESQMIPQNNS
ncbi:solute carrier family 49 member 4 homolog [Microplitis mediator]|uniref:solute carrier family 49 member 4 homolog n=1 Tax=Microplitis mediator TaxID=375433 RepID=UPI00255695AB|nr:solute carrier family 49 member 4 homolog [Microplitis mediator]